MCDAYDYGKHGSLDSWREWYEQMYDDEFGQTPQQSRVRDWEAAGPQDGWTSSSEAGDKSEYNLKTDDVGTSMCGNHGWTMKPVVFLVVQRSMSASAVLSE